MEQSVSFKMAAVLWAGNPLLWNFSVKYLHLQQIFSNFASESVVPCQETTVDFVNMTAKENIDGGSKGLRGNRSFPAIFNALYLAVPDILLTHTGAPSLISL
ncbi:MAG: hypothetical protein ACTTH4_04550 [Prevotella denticola]|uniref:hypothetical protein n=1 Tax=Prevotella denticola TaxID=28129 RepID=UPI003FA021F4